MLRAHKHGFNLLRALGCVDDGTRGGCVLRHVDTLHQRRVGHRHGAVGIGMIGMVCRRVVSKRTFAATDGILAFQHSLRWLAYLPHNRSDFDGVVIHFAR